MTNELKAKAEAMLQGFVVSVKPEEVKDVTLYALTVMKNCKQVYGSVEEKTEEIMARITRYHKNNVEWMCVNEMNIWGDKMIQITYVYKDGRKKLTSEMGRLAYVINLTAPDCSEMGYVFFQEKFGRVHRVG